MLAEIDTVFLDRDGVINRRLPGDYVKSWAEFEFLPRAKEALALLTAANLRLIVITNQRGIARGLMTEDDLRAVHERMLAELREAGAHISAVYHCPHDRDACECRKPKTGLLLAAQRDFPEIDFARSVVVGDAPSDIEAGKRLGCRTVFVGAASGHDGTELRAATLYDAARLLARP
jgi:D-glycero-D-manno-heptose 1,7-bisphosphate phosphatase